ncbi:lipopolysaccharide biosynthesis protein [Allopontixanthobacter sp.]|uniref:lipopolysaccharide biosynthesis protein n=1 Tax=Allopontixanthobacter sp. TaxID=2906452 RepID=UPI002ABCEBED|nr:oligosaccharide flippase family protein [Allopontixanthobacter sp.]MDZ4306671.1 oligosaccharide flippase family protein [Allopontixanthobacter sp.]
MMRRILANAGWLLGGKGVNAALSLVYLAIATRALGLAEFGQFTLVVALAQALTGIASFQTWLFVVRWGNSAAQDPVQDRKTGTRDVIGFATALDLASMALGTLAAGALALSALHWVGLSADLGWPTFLFCAVSMLAIRSTPTGILRLHDRYARAAGAETAIPVIRAIGAGLAALFMPTIIGFLLAWAAAELAAAAACWAAAARFGRPQLSAISLTRLPRQEAGVWRFVLSTNFSSSTGVAGRQVLLLMVGAFGGATMAGIYRVAAQLGLAILKLGQAVLQAIFPDLVRAGPQDHVLAGRIARVAAVTALASIALAVAGGEVLIAAVAGPEFSAAYVPMIILAAASAIELVGASWDALLVARRRAGLVLALRAVPMAAALALVPWAISVAGASGAAAASLLASTLAVGGLFFFARLVTRPARPVAE